MATFETVVNNVETLLRQEPGISVQQYSEDNIAMLLQNSFDRLFATYWFPEYYNAGEEFTLDGTTGKVTDDLTAKIKSWKDVRFIWKAPYVQPLNRRAAHINPIATYGLDPQWEPVAGNKIFRMVPITTTGSIVVAYRTKPDDFIAADTMLIDTDVMEAEAVRDYLADDASNEIAIKKWESKLSEREQLYRSLQNAGPRPLAPGRGGPLTVWTSQP